MTPGAGPTAGGELLASYATLCTAMFKLLFHQTELLTVLKMDLLPTRRGKRQKPNQKDERCYTCFAKGHYTKSCPMENRAPPGARPPVRHQTNDW